MSMETYAHYEQTFPPKSGLYALREGPYLAQNIIKFIKKEPMVKYIPQKEYLSLITTADDSGIGTKFGISFTGRWV